MFVNTEFLVFDAMPAVIFPPYIIEFFIYRLLIFPSKLVNKAFWSSTGLSMYKKYNSRYYSL